MEALCADLVMPTRFTFEPRPGFVGEAARGHRKNCLGGSRAIIENFGSRFAPNL